jgi:hypothetical protein
MAECLRADCNILGDNLKKVPWQLFMFRNKTSFHGEELSTYRPTSKLENHPLSAVRDCLFNIFAGIFLIGGRSSIRNLRTCHAVVIGTHITIIKTMYNNNNNNNNIY